jgi:hypothetical protein
MRRLTLLIALTAAAVPLGAGGASADTTVVADPTASQPTTLGGTLVWVSSSAGGQVLMQRTPAGIARVPGAPRAAFYRSVDLGRDADGDLVLTYRRCRTAASCSTLRDDLHGHRTPVRGLEPSGCALSTAPALWGTRAAYGLACFKRSGGQRVADDARSGLYVRAAGRAPRRLPLPKDAVRFGISDIERVDLRGTRVAAVAADIYSYVFSQTVGGNQRHSFLAAASEGDSDEHVVGLALGTRTTAWSLTDAEHAGDPNLAIVNRLRGACRDWEQLANPAGPDQETGYRAVALAADGGRLYLVVPGVGFVRHQYAPQHPC